MFDTTIAQATAPVKHGLKMLEVIDLDAEGSGDGYDAVVRCACGWRDYHHAPIRALAAQGAQRRFAAHTQEAT
jgi:hypothetical protein